MLTNWEEIQTQHAPRMWSIAWRILRHESDALDCCQDVFAEAVSHARESSMEPIMNWGAFLSWLTTRRAIDLLRKRNRHSQPSLLGDQDVLLTSQLDSTTASLEFSELVNLVRSQLANMNGQLAECFWLCCVEEMSYAEVAEQLGITTGHVGVNVHRARELLMKKLAGQNLREDTAN